LPRPYGMISPMRKAILFLSILLTAFGVLAQSGQVQQPKSTWQTPGQIQQPKGPWQKPGDIQKAGDIQSVKTDRCHQRLTVGADALFEFNQATLTDAAQQTLATLGPMIQNTGKHPVSIEGNTDSIGTTQYNQDLSEKRAKAVEDWLVAHNYVDAATAAVVGYGKTHPVAPNTKPDGSDNPGGRTKNRRVEVVIDTCH
jgi:outer membrane protein OmpA-like peptidoglycan-associated protein